MEQKLHGIIPDREGEYRAVDPVEDAPVPSGIARPPVRRVHLAVEAVAVRADSEREGRDQDRKKTENHPGKEPQTLIVNTV